ncbi:hypothetical protein KW787_00160 [Candidatus Pacearchaeota archaeon]|nr:hypothetical protein [Candidatus Pacearchaeota archaeon]
MKTEKEYPQMSRNYSAFANIMAALEKQDSKIREYRMRMNADVDLPGKELLRYDDLRELIVDFMSQPLPSHYDELISLVSRQLRKCGNEIVSLAQIAAGRLEGNN